MAQLDNLLGSDLAKGVVVGIGLAILMPVAATAMAPLLRPVARSALKAGILALEKGREVAAEFGELVEDVMAEVHEELRGAREDAPGGIEGVTEAGGAEPRGAGDAGPLDPEAPPAPPGP